MGIAVSIDGQLVEPDEARISIFDHGFLFGDSVYEVVRTRRGVPVTLDEHLERLRASAAEIYLDLPWSHDDLRAAVRRVLDAAGNDESYLRVIVTRGVGEISLLPDSCEKPGLIVLVRPLPVPPPSVAEQGLAVVVSGRVRNDQRALSPAAKTGNYLNNVLALVEARRDGADDAILLNPAGHVAEGTTSNVFFVEGDALRTPSLDCGILAGITRSLLVEALRGDGVEVEEGEYPVERLLGADEAFLTSTVRGVAPIRSLDGKPVGAGRPGPVARRVAEVYERELDRLATAGD